MLVLSVVGYVGTVVGYVGTAVDYVGAVVGYVSAVVGYFSTVVDYVVFQLNLLSNSSRNCQNGFVSRFLVHFGNFITYFGGAPAEN